MGASCKPPLKFLKDGVGRKKKGKQGARLLTVLVVWVGCEEKSLLLAGRRERETERWWGLYTSRRQGFAPPSSLSAPDCSFSASRWRCTSRRGEGNRKNARHSLCDVAPRPRANGERDRRRPMRQGLAVAFKPPPSANGKAERGRRVTCSGVEVLPAPMPVASKWQLWLQPPSRTLQLTHLSLSLYILISILIFFPDWTRAIWFQKQRAQLGFFLLFWPSNNV